MLNSKRNVKVITTIVIPLFLIIIFVIFLHIKANKHVAANAGINAVRQVVIDAGHGGQDPGAIGINNVAEKGINLNIALNLRDILTFNGYEVIMTRETDKSIHNPIYREISKQKTSDLKNRLKIIHDHPNSIVISIHQNHFEQSKYKGAQMFYGKNNKLSKPLAAEIQSAFISLLQKDNTRQIKQSTRDVYIIHNAHNPIVLTECGFLSNEEDSKNLCDEEYQKKVAFTIFIGINNFFTNNS